MEPCKFLRISRQDLAAALDRLPGEIATLLYSAIRQSAEDLMRKQPGRKAFILLTDGVAIHDPTTMGTAIEFAPRADTIRYTIASPITSEPAVRCEPRCWPRPPGTASRRRMASETGGRRL